MRELPAQRAVSLRTALFVALALCGFASNSLLCRAALGAKLVDPWTFTGVRLASGALVISLLALRRSPHRAGSFTSAAALFAYALTFSLAYVRIGAGPGALILFGVVQVTMIGRSVQQGHALSPREWLGLLLASLGLVALLLPGAHAPDALGALLMVCAGLAWGAYSLLGRAQQDPLATTAGNFLRCVPLAALCLLLGLLRGQPAQQRGLLFAATSGALSSGVGYSLWYAALPHLTRARAAILQLSVPPLALAAAALLLGEAPSVRLLACGTAILAGVALAVLQPATR